jgi:hypothetical protein
VCSLVIDAGGTEDQAIAALLHDAPEDQGGLALLAEIEQRFGASVAEIVEACSDTFDDPKPPWRPRKEAYIARLEEESPYVLLVSLADKVHNARSILADLRTDGEALWDRFSGGRDGTLWYYRRLAEVLLRLLPENALAQELDRIVGQIMTRATLEPSGAQDRPTRCPVCGHEPVAEVLYGMPAFSEELQRDLETGRTVIGGCVVSGDEPLWACKRCGARISALGVAVRQTGDVIGWSGRSATPSTP